MTPMFHHRQTLDFQGGLKAYYKCLGLPEIQNVWPEKYAQY